MIGDDSMFVWRVARRATIVLATIVLMALAQVSALAETARLTVQVNRQEISVGDSFRLTISVRGIDGDVGDPRLPDGMQIEGRSAQTSMSMVFGKGAEKETRVIYSVSALKAGKFTLGPFAVKAGKTQVRSNSVEITVLPAGSTQRAAQKGTGGTPKPGVFLVADVSKKSLWVHETFELTLKLLYRLPISNARLRDTDFSAFDVYDGKELEQREYETTVEGIDYRVIELRRRLAPRKAGEIVIPPVRIEVDVKLPQDKRTGDPFQDFFSDDSFFDSPFFSRTERKIISSPPVTLSVRTLPEPKPADWSGIVGEVNVSANLSKRELDVGENATFTVKIEGNADLSGVTLPAPAVRDDLKVYPDKPVLEHQLDPQGRLIDSKTFLFGVVPTKSGVVSLPFQGFSVFDSAKGTYEHKSLAAETLMVRGGNGGTTSVAPLAPTGTAVDQKQVVEQGSDILPPREGMAKLAEDRRVGLRLIATWLALPGFLLALLLALHLYDSVRERSSTLDPVRAARRAHALWLSDIRTIQKQPSAKESDNFETLLRALRIYVGRKTGNMSAAYTAEEMREAARQHGVKTEIAQALFDLVSKAELCCIVSGAAQKEDFKRMLSMAQGVVARVEKEWA